MSKRRLLACGLVLGVACGGPIEPAPSLFPMAQVWTAPLDEQARGPLASDGHLVFVATGDGDLRGLDLVSGDARWRLAGRPGALSARSGLLVAREPDGTVWGMDPETGSARWKTETAVAGTVPAVFDGDRVVVAGDGLAVLEAANGHVVWALPREPKASAAPVPSGPCLLVPEADGTLRCREPGTGKSLWTYASGGPVLAPPVVDDKGHVFLGTTARGFVSLRFGDGHRRWRWKLGADVRTPAVLLDDQVVFASHEAVLYALRRNGNMSWRTTLPSRPLGPPLLLGRGVIVACYGSRPSETLLLGFDGRNGKRLGELRTPAEVQGEPLLVGDRLVMALRDLRVVGLQLAAPSETGTAHP